MIQADDSNAGRLMVANVELQEEITRLRQRVEELEEAVIHWRKVVKDCYADYKERGDRLEEFRELYIHAFGLEAFNRNYGGWFKNGEPL